MAKHHEKRDYISLIWLSDTGLGETGSTRTAVKFQLRDTPAHLL